MSWQDPTQEMLEHKYPYDSGTEFSQNAVHAHPSNWNGGVAQPPPQAYPVPFHPGTSVFNASGQLGNHQFQPQFGMSSRPASDRNGNPTLSASYLPGQDFTPRYVNGITPHPNNPYTSSNVAQGLSYPPQVAPAGRTFVSYASEHGPDSRSRSPSNAPPRLPVDPQLQHLQAHQGSPFQQPPLRSQPHASDMSNYVQAKQNYGVLRTKRSRVLDEPYGEYDGTDDGDFEPLKDDSGKTKPGACTRCKNLKVKCEFRLENDICKRCTNGGHDCVIPGRKKRRVPPKREYLLGQIRDQAVRIDQLMQQLEAANSKASAASPPADGVPAAELKPAQLEYDADNHGQSQAEVQDWVAKARESIEAFGGYIGVGAASSYRDTAEESDSEDSDSYGEADGESDYAEAVSEHGARFDDSLSHRASPEEAGKRKDLEKLATVPSPVTPVGLMANLSLRRSRITKGANGEDEDGVGMAREDYFKAANPDPTQRLSDLQQHPAILTRGIVTPEDVDKLFKLYFETMNLSLSLLDPVLYTSHSTFYRSPFLFTVICAIASRHYDTKPSLYQEAMRYARLAAGTALISGKKTVETVSAYILLSLCPMPVKSWEEERGWLFLGAAIRVGIELNLHIRSTVKPRDEIHARELLNRTRVWLNCYNLDRSTGSQTGKGPMIRNDDYVACHSHDWWKSSEFNMRNFDIHTCAYNAELQLVGRFRATVYSDPNHPTGLNKGLDFEKLASETDDQLVALKEHWSVMFEQNTDPDSIQSHFRIGLVWLGYTYARLVALSFGLQHMTGKDRLEDNPFVTRCWRAAMDVCVVVLGMHIPEQFIFLRRGPEAQSFYLSFAAAFLIKLLHPKYIPCFNVEQRQGMYDMVVRVAEALGNPQVYIDEQHWPKLYSRLLQGLLADAKIDPKKGRSKTKSQSPGASPKGSSQPSPAMTGSTPLAPSAQPSAVKEMYGQQSRYYELHSTEPSQDAGAAMETGTFPTNTPEYFVVPPLPFDSDMLQSMHSLTNSWVLPGMNWMGQNQGTDTHMVETTPMDPRMYYNSQSYGS